LNVTAIFSSEHPLPRSDAEPATASTPVAGDGVTDSSTHGHMHIPPCVTSIIRRLAVNLLIACVVPAVVFTSLMLGLGITSALIGTLCWSYSAIGWQVFHGKRLSGLLVVTSSVLTLRTLVALASGDTFIYFMQPVATDAFIATAFFVSLLTARPVVARLAGDFYPLTPEVASRERVVRLFRGLTLLWAAACTLKATVTFWLLQTQSVESFVMIKNAFVLSVNSLTISVTVGAAILVARREGLLTARGHVEPVFAA
jgi:hypothetical protein